MASSVGAKNPFAIFPEKVAKTTIPTPDKIILETSVDRSSQLTAHLSLETPVKITLDRVPGTHRMGQVATHPQAGKALALTL